ncbi:ThuA domain-containing protein [Aquipuribacter sp. SD81]|uniref:ThuA domain-containing protein n=1 Tax=Aquipuribacter sp. SD81 TaxID=3127703 RepID=UPI003018D557
MGRPRRTALVTMLGAVALAAPTAAALPAAADDHEYDVLVVGKTLGFRHSSIDEATTAIIALGDAHGFTVDVWDPQQPERTLTSTPFTDAGLDKYETVVFVSTVDGTNNLDPARPTLLDSAELEAFQGYIRDGGGFAGIHAATDSMHTIPWYSQLTGGGARFVGHPAQQTAVQDVVDQTHPSTEHLDSTWTRFDEWYNFNVSPSPYVRVLTNIDESTYNPGRTAMGEDHPLAWCHNFEGARSWYTAGGHTEASYVEPAFLQHVLGGIQWTAGVVDGGGDCVTWYEIDTLMADLIDSGELSRNAERQLVRHYEAAKALAESGDHAGAAERLNGLKGQVRGHVKDEELRELLADKADDLQTWQLGLS